MARAARTARRLWDGVVWYLREATGEADYDRYVQRHRRAHPGAPVLTRREYERSRTDHRENNPNPRCC